MRCILILIMAITSIMVFAETEYEDKLPYPKIIIKPGDDIALIKKGEYLTKAGDCVACHTVKGGKSFAGGLGMRTPFGTYYSPNITPNKKYGLGSWTEQDFIKAMKKGVSKDGSHLFPVFPYIYYSKVTDEDLKAIWAYLKAIPSADTPNKPIDALLPFRIRFSQLFWKLLFFKPYDKPFEPDATKSKTWNRGAYLVQGLGHCSMCHTPINMLGAPKRDLLFTGGYVDGYYAPNLTDSMLSSVTVKQITRVFYADELPGGGKVKGPMAQVNHDSLSYLKPDDIYAIAVYIKSLKDPRGPNALTADSSQSKGQQVYDKYCAACHNSGAAGAPKINDSSAWNERLEKGKDMLHKNAIQGYNSMPAKGGCVSCSDDDIIESVDYILAIAQNASGVKIHQVKVKPAPQVSYEVGRNVYNKYCSTCHNDKLFNSASPKNSKYWQERLDQGIEVLYSRTINGYKAMPAKGGCNDCSNLDVIAAVKYLLQVSIPEYDFRLW